MTDFKKEEIAEHFQDYLKDNEVNTRNELPQDWEDDLHHQVFNTDYYIIGRHQAKKWLEDEAFNVIEIIKEYEQSNFGEVYTDFSDPEKVVNMYTYIVGEEIVFDYLNEPEEAKIRGKL